LTVKSHAWKPIVYLTASLCAVAIALTLAYLLASLIIPGFTLVGLRRAEGKLMLAVACGIAYGTVLATNWLLKRMYGREFGTYLDEPDDESVGLHPTLEKRCSRCGTVFGAFHNDFHAAGFCSRACHQAIESRKDSPPKRL
jgi:ribosomal protein S27AE